MSTLQVLVGVSVGGALGGIARYWLSTVVARRFGAAFPWGTLVVNVSGALLIGVIAAVLQDRAHAVWFWAVYGFLGSYTTVSSFSLQTLELLHTGAPGRALGNVVLSLVCCLGAAACGLWLGGVL